jgi:hypothetical protein
VDYFRKHWEGELPLVTAFWVNVFLIGVALRFFETWFGQTAPIENPVISARFAVAYFALSVFLLYPWQVVGVWRSAANYRKGPQSGVWGRVVQVVVSLGILGTVGNLLVSLPVHSDLFKIGFAPDEFANYTIGISDDGSLIHLEGGLGFGISDEVSDFIAKNNAITGIILDSPGGRIYEGRELAKIILANELDTYSLAGCYSACGTAFVAGHRRYLGNGANLAFHQYAPPGENIGLHFDMGTEQEQDVRIYRMQGVSEDFIERLFLAESDDLWYPTVPELLESGVVHSLVDSSDLVAVDYPDFKTNEIHAEIAKYRAFKAIKAHEPEIYDNIVAELERKMRTGATRLDIQQALAAYIDALATESLPRTSNQALIEFTVQTTRILKKLEDQDPILCIKNLFPAQYGSLDLMNHLSLADLTPIMDSFGLVIVDSYESQNPAIDTVAAEYVFAEVANDMGEELMYLENPLLEDRQDYSNACHAAIRFYELLMAYDEDTTGNALRYAFSP